MADRSVNLTDGVAMIVTDLHGDRGAFDMYMQRFRDLFAAGEVQRLVLLGDLIHGYGPVIEDDSLQMVLDVIDLQAEFGADTVIMLLGNHEMPHIYGVSLFKGDLEFTPRFERSLGHHRERVLTFFRSLPFFVRTAAGVSLCHAGPEIDFNGQMETLRGFDHDVILAEADAILAESESLDVLYDHYSRARGVSYAEEARYLLAIDGPDDPRYPELLRAFMISQQDQRFSLLWRVLFTQNEHGMSELAYLNATRTFLDALSVDIPVKQRAIVSGHIATPGGGHKLVNRFHLRLASAAHATPREAGLYLLLDCAQPVEDATALLNGLGSVFLEEHRVRGVS